MNNYIQYQNQDNFIEKQKLGQNAENVLRAEAELAGRPYKMVGSEPTYYDYGDIIYTDTNEIVEVKSDCQIMQNRNILFEHSFIKPKTAMKITKYNMNALDYITCLGWLQKGKYEKIVFIDMKYFLKFEIDFQKAKAFISVNENNPKIVKKVIKLNKDENKIGTYYLIKYELLYKEGILNYGAINPMVRFWLKGHYDPNNFRMNWTMNNLHFIPIN